MFSVTFSQPIIIDATNLHSLLSLTNTPAVVAPYAGAVAVEAPKAPKAARVQKPAAEASGDKPKRTRATKAEMEARRLAEAGGTGGEEPKEEEPKEEEPKEEEPKEEEPKEGQKTKATPVVEKLKLASKPAVQKTKVAPKVKASAPSTDSAELLERFAKLIDIDFGKASGILEGFGVKRFSEITTEKYEAFDAKLTEAGV